MATTLTHSKISLGVTYSKIVQAYYKPEILERVAIKKIPFSLGITSIQTAVSYSHDPREVDYAILDRNGKNLIITTENSENFLNFINAGQRLINVPCDTCGELTQTPMGIPIRREQELISGLDGNLYYCKVFHDIGNFCSYRCILEKIHEKHEEASLLQNVLERENFLREIFMMEYPERTFSMTEKIPCKGTFFYKRGICISLPCKTQIVKSYFGQQLEHLPSENKCYRLDGLEITYPDKQKIIAYYKQLFLNSLKLN